MEKGFGIAGLVIAIVAIFIPVAGIFVSAVALVLVGIGALAGDRIFTTATAMIAIVNTMFLSPSLWIILQTKSDQEQRFYVILTMLFVAFPFAAMALNAAGKGSRNRITLGSMGGWAAPRLNYIVGVFVIVLLLWTIWGNGPRMIALVTDAITSVRGSKLVETRNSILPYNDETYRELGARSIEATTLIQGFRKATAI
jgi:hypothetical protein